MINNGREGLGTKRGSGGGSKKNAGKSWEEHRKVGRAQRVVTEGREGVGTNRGSGHGTNKGPGKVR